MMTAQEILLLYVEQLETVLNRAVNAAAEQGVLEKVQLDADSLARAVQLKAEYEAAKEQR